MYKMVDYMRDAGATCRARKSMKLHITNDSGRQMNGM